ncbi:MAG: restriction endonuclease [Flavobacteriales bacterium]|nr:restriction endonuclease [Flavobacteriales bacterium]
MPSLYYGDNLYVLRESIPDESVDLIYLDPPFNSKRDYNLLFKSPKGQASDAQIEAFEDTWHWNQQAEYEYDELLKQVNTDVAELMKALRSFLGENDMMAYLTMMANRLLELHRVLKPTGSLYLHCDPTASHYLKIVLDAVFGKERFSSEVIWKRTSAHSDTKGYAAVHDVIFYYNKSDSWTWNPQFEPYSEEYVETHFVHEDADGRLFRRVDLRSPNPRPNLTYNYKASNGIVYKPHANGWAVSLPKMEALDRGGSFVLPQKADGRLRRKLYLDDSPGVAVTDNWTDIKPIFSAAEERLGYPTQKPLALLERIIQASSNEGDVVLDPFCGCGTAVHAAQKLKRNWIGIDITHLAVSLIEKRLKDAFGEDLKFDIHGTPEDLDSASDLAQRDKYQFQWWAVSLVQAQPYGGKKKGADGGVDGIKFFHDIDKQGARKIVVSVKGGHLKADDVRALNHVRERESADIALFISLDKPTKGMVADAASAGLYESPNGQKYPRVQLLTIADLLSRKARAQHPDYKPDLNFKKAKREVKKGGQKGLFE